MDVEILKNAGVDYDEGLKRFAGKSILYEKYIRKFLTDPTFDNLKKAMENEDYKEAFSQAHTFKGLVGNLSFNEILVLVKPFVELLRNGEVDKAQESFPAIEMLYDNLYQVIEALVEDGD